MKNFWLRLHYTAVAIALALFALQAFILPIPHGNLDTSFEIPICIQIALLLFLYGFISGMVLMARRKGNSESILLAISTLTPLLLPVVAMLWHLLTHSSQ